MPDFSELIFQVKNKQAISNIDEVNKSLIKTEKSATNLFKTLAAGWSLTKITQGINFLTNKFRDLQIATNNYAAIFGNFNRTAEQGLNNLINNFNETEVSAKRLLALIGSRIDFDFGANEIGQISADIGRLSRELSTFFGMNIDQVALKLTNALSGQTRGLRELGISIDTTSPKFKALIQNLQDSKGYSEEAAKAYAVYSQILQKTQKYEGSFSKQSTTLFQAIGDLKNTLNSGVFAKAGEILNTLFVPLIKQLNEFFSSSFVSTIGGFQLAIGSIIFGVASLVKLIENIDKKTDDIQVKTVTTGKLIKNQTKSISETVNKSIDVIRGNLAKTEAAAQRLLKKQQNLAYMPEVVSYYKKLTKDIYNIDPSDTKKLNEYNQKLWETKKEIQKFQDQGFLSYELTATQRYRRFVKENKEKIAALNEESAKIAKKSIKIAEVSTKTFGKINFDNVPRGVLLAVEALEKSEELSNTFSVKLNNIGKKIKTSIVGMFGKIKSLLSAIPELFLKIELIQLVWVTAYNFGKSISQAFFDGFNESKFETISDYISDQIIYFWERLWNNINGLGWNTDYQIAIKKSQTAIKNIELIFKNIENTIDIFNKEISSIWSANQDQNILPDDIKKIKELIQKRTSEGNKISKQIKETSKQYLDALLNVNSMKEEKEAKEAAYKEFKNKIEKLQNNYKAELQQIRKIEPGGLPAAGKITTNTLTELQKQKKQFEKLSNDLDSLSKKYIEEEQKLNEAIKKNKSLSEDSFKNQKQISKLKEHLNQVLTKNYNEDLKNLDLYRKTLNKFNDNYRALQEDIMSFTKDDISDLKVTNISERINDIIEELKRPDLKIDEKFNLYQEEQKLIIDNAKIRIDALKKEYQEILKFKEYVISMWDKITSFINRGVQAIEVGTSSGIAFAGSSTSSYAPISEWLKYSTDKQSSLDEQMKDIQAETQQKVDGIYQEIKQIVPALQNITIIRGVNA